jgi:hypothetical protein
MFPAKVDPAHGESMQREKENECGNKGKYIHTQWLPLRAK